MSDQQLVPIPASRREPVPGAQRVADIPDDDELRVSIVVRRKAGGREKALQAAATRRPGSLSDRRRQLTEQAGADQADLDRVTQWATAAGMRVLSADPATRTVMLIATAAQASAAFGVSLGRYQTRSFSYRGREGAVHLPPEVAEVVQAVLGLDNRPQAGTHLKRGAALPAAQFPALAAQPQALLPELTPGQAAAPSPRPDPQPMWPMQVASLYAFPADMDGSGQTIGIIELGGGFTSGELATYFERAKEPAPTVEAISVGRGQNNPGPDAGADGEVMLDIEVAGAVAPGAHIAVYFGGNTDRDFHDALATAIHDAGRSPSVVTISWGSREDRWTGQARQVFDDVLVDAAALGVTVLAAAGDHGAGDGSDDGRAHADYPASSPYVIGCGGTTLFLANGQPQEVAWNDGNGWATGGGISDVYDPPSWQDVTMPASLGGTGRPGRGVPDIAGNADIASGYITLADGQWGPVGGTSAVAPLYAGLVARLNQALGYPVKDLLPTLYGLPAADRAEVFTDVTTGNNSVPRTADFGPAVTGYDATPGWDACTGLGSINGTALLERLRALSTAPAAAASS
ncbi:MAG TPA: S53 family peptidase [Streptosporangiaceae bacterium]